jgi:hypothetical protein
MRWALGSQGTSVGIATSYRLDNGGVGVRVSIGAIFSLFYTSSRPVLGLTHPSYWMGTGTSFPGGKATGAWSWPLTSNWCRGQENKDLYMHSPIPLHGVVVNWMSTGRTLPLWDKHLNSELFKQIPVKIAFVCAVNECIHISVPKSPPSISKPNSNTNIFPFLNPP